MDNDQIVCNCMSVTVKDLKDAIASGAKSFDEVQEKTSVGTGCGQCVDGVKVIVDELLGK
jgi:bacterioferritin-associated ferredoxin